MFNMMVQCDFAVFLKNAHPVTTSPSLSSFLISTEMEVSEIILCSYFFLCTKMFSKAFLNMQK